MNLFNSKGLILAVAGVFSAGQAGAGQGDPTIRTMAGAARANQLDPNSTALLVIDFQNEYFTGKMPIPDGVKALNNAKRLVDFADNKKIPVFHVQHVLPAGAPLFAEGSESVKFHPELQPQPGQKVVRKNTVSVFPSTDLDAQLKAAGIKTLIVSGLMTHACVAGAARDAIPLGYEVIVSSDATATRDIDAAGIGAIKHEELHRGALVGIADTFGDVMTTKEIVAMPLKK
jgi:nicotinamidase-related amidase